MLAGIQLTSVRGGCPNPNELVAVHARLLDAEITASEWVPLPITGDSGTITLNLACEKRWQTSTRPGETDHHPIPEHVEVFPEDLTRCVPAASRSV